MALSDMFVCQNPQRIMYVKFSRTNSGDCICYFFVWLNFIFLHNSLWITLPNESSLVIFFFYYLTVFHSNVIVSTISTQNLHCYFFCFVSTCFDIPCRKDIVQCCYQNTFIFSLKTSLPLATSKFSRMRFHLFVSWNLNTIIFLLCIFLLFSFCWRLCCLYCFWWL